MATSNAADHYLKRITFKGNTCGIVTQNENGPCALLGLANVLILRNSMSISSNPSTVSNGELLDRISDLLLLSVPDNSTSTEENSNTIDVHDSKLNSADVHATKLDPADIHASKLNSALEFLACLPWEMEVDVKFTAVTAFSPSPGMDLFSLLRVPLFHTWLVDPTAADLASVIGDLSYVELTDRVITYKSSGEKSKNNEATLSKDFLEMAPNQTMKYGLSQLTESMDEDQLGVLFRNNHFATIYKKDGTIYQLVTDEGYLTRKDIVWETVTADGASKYLNQDFENIFESISTAKTCPNLHSLALNPTVFNLPEWTCGNCAVTKLDSDDMCFLCVACNYYMCSDCYFPCDNTRQSAQPVPGSVCCPMGHEFKVIPQNQLIFVKFAWECFACGSKIMAHQTSQTYDCPCPYFLCGQCYTNQKNYDGWKLKEENNSSSAFHSTHSRADRNQNSSIPVATVKTCQHFRLRVADVDLSNWKCDSCSQAYVGGSIVCFHCAQSDQCEFKMCGNCFYKM